MTWKDCVRCSLQCVLRVTLKIIYHVREEERIEISVLVFFLSDLNITTFFRKLLGLQDGRYGFQTWYALLSSSSSCGGHSHDLVFFFFLKVYTMFIFWNKLMLIMLNIFLSVFAKKAKTKIANFYWTRGNTKNNFKCLSTIHCGECYWKHRTWFVKYKKKKISCSTKKVLQFFWYPALLRLRLQKK